MIYRWSSRRRQEHWGQHECRHSGGWKYRSRTGISAGILLTFVIIFNEFLVTLFIAGPSTTTAALRVYNLTRTAGFQPSTAALATTMQLVSFVVYCSSSASSDPAISRGRT